MSQDVQIRHISPDDWGGIVALESRAYGAIGLSEDRAALESRARASPATCFVLDLEKRLVGYLLALPYPMFRYPDLTRAEDITFPSRNLHLHDLVIAEGLRRRGLAHRLLHHLTAKAAAHGYRQLSLVAVAGSAPFWSANGFLPHDEAVPPESYGADAVYMYRAIPSDRVLKPQPAGDVLRGPSAQHGRG
ncbi:GNAT family N-acetyltransferase [Streptomyces pinistramenti]|uniref:GNAT family N-acetyltransferase n=1 Tax=Streptomyces pinistramenti TaxID=2884812 RepID=UPI001D08F09F|nr:GNAT family N-acetyltransferase [Streptomyces pinistramenti]MCB5906325.1 GNAT family N-acetyltransferase [Streptomyces pinistramenti]